MAADAANRATRPFCSAVSRARHEPLAATASRVDHWLLVEYRSRWTRDAPADSILPAGVKEHLRTQVAARPHTRLLFVKRTGRRAAAGSTVLVADARRERLGQVVLETLDDLRSLELTPGAPGLEEATGPLFLVCTHGKHDRCCATYGRPLYDALRHAAEPGRVWQSTHLGGDRFAGNVVVLPHGLYYGRVAPEDAAALLAEHAEGRIDVERYRGRSTHSFPVQAAELELRSALGLSGIADLALHGVKRTGEGAWRVRFRDRDGRPHAVEVTAGFADEPQLLTCGASEPRRARRYEAKIVPR